MYFGNNGRAVVGNGVFTGTTKRIFRKGANTDRYTVNRAELRKHMFGIWVPVFEKMLQQGNRLSES